MNSVGDAFSYAFRDPQWVSKVAVQGLILIIPIVGWIAAFGWMMNTLDNLRAGRAELAPAGFHLERGIGIFGVVVIYSIVLSVPAWFLEILGAIVAGAAANNGYYYSGSPLAVLGELLTFPIQLFIDFLLPSMIVLTYHYGFSGGLNVQHVWRMATGNVQNSVIGGLVIFVAGFIGGFGILACCIGIFFTSIYATAIICGVAAWFERVQAAPAAPAA